VRSLGINTGLVKYEFHNLVVHGPSALLASVAGECAQEQGRFWAFHDQMFESVFPGRNLEDPKAHDLGQLLDMAGLIELDVAEFGRCLQDSDAKLKSCQAEQDQCIAAAGERTSCSDARNRCMVTNEPFQRISNDRDALPRLLGALSADEQVKIERVGTPTFFINGHILIGAVPYEEFKTRIDLELERAKRR
jgi:protein-disulfide isomerase